MDKPFECVSVSAYGGGFVLVEFQRKDGASLALTIPESEGQRFARGRAYYMRPTVFEVADGRALMPTL